MSPVNISSTRTRPDQAKTPSTQGIPAAEYMRVDLEPRLWLVLPDLAQSRLNREYATLDDDHSFRSIAQRGSHYRWPPQCWRYPHPCS